jgi:para-nitrobenzyl esterase
VDQVGLESSFISPLPALVNYHHFFPSQYILFPVIETLIKRLNMKLLLLASTCLMPAIFHVVTAKDITSRVELKDGILSGCLRDANDVLAFKGIPFAEPPLGHLRWRPPLPASPWNGVLSATEFGHTCWNSLLDAPIPTPESEDCLTINIWTAASQSCEKRPVMVWLYGGGFQFGASALATYDGTMFAQQGVVLVSFNYRLGILGFLALAELDMEGTSSGNFGLQDMQAALEWIRKNIDAFGGDPDNITIFGESAGSHAIGLLMSSPRSRGLFHKAIMESGAWWDRNHGSLSTFDEARRFGDNFKIEVGVNSVAELRETPPQSLVNASLFSFSQDPGIENFSPNIDGYVLPTAPGSTFQNGRQMKIPLMAGWNAGEQSAFLGLALPHRNAVQYESAAEILFAPRMPEFLSLYPTSSALLNASSDALIGDLMIRQQTWEAADLQQKSGVPDVFVYYFTYASAYSPLAAHTAEIPFVFGNLDTIPIYLLAPAAPFSPEDRAFSQHVIAYWTNFAKHSNPNNETAGLPTWPTYRSSNDDILELGNTITPIAYGLDRFRFIQSFRENGVLPLGWRKLNVSTSGQ